LGTANFELLSLENCPKFFCLGFFGFFFSARGWPLMAILLPLPLV
jgi:hypothetical protein